MNDTLRPGAPPPTAAARPPQAGPPPLPMPSLRKGRLKIAYWGPPFSGKTEAMCSWPSPVVLQFDPDARTARKRKPLVPVLQLPLEMYHQEVLPAIRERRIDDFVRRIVDPDTGDMPFREYVTQTLIKDSWTFYASAVLALCPAGSTTNKHEPWQKLLDRCRLTANILNAATQPDSQGRAYHYLAAIHEEKDMEADKVVEILPTLQGKFANEFFAHFNAVLQTYVKTGPSYKVKTRPTNLRPRMGDRVGGGSLGVLPEVCNGDYKTLMQAWGLPT